MAKKVYENQTKLRLRADLKLEEDENILNCDTIIKYVKPDKTTGSFVATIEDAYKGLIYYDVVLPTEIVGVGKWILWAYVTFPDGRVVPGEPFIMEVFKEGTIC